MSVSVSRELHGTLKTFAGKTPPQKECSDMMGRRRFAVIGGDMRLVRLAGMLAELGHEVILYACEKAPQPNNTTMAKTLREAAAGADCAVLPLPLSAKEGVL
ncbi:MAG: hypothetical protein GX823_05870, partial [Clostridiales bacterium]|nr:hypothetical protein [Clostridiales bacterium]